MRYSRIAPLLVLFTYTLTAQIKKDSSFCFVAFGDMPYFLPADYSRFETVIKTINDLKPQFSINVGDFKASATPCSDEVFLKMLNYYGQFNRPLIYTPGDNEWTDCTKKIAGPYDPEERLETLRKMFFKERNSLGQIKMPLTSQCLQRDFSKYVENNRWEYGNVAFATIHIVGSNNNFLSTSINNNQEFFDRQKADMAWLEEIFKTATEKKNVAIVIAIQADMFFTIKDKDASGYNQIRKRLKELTLEFKKPVVLINGDSHVFIVDKPMMDETKAKTSIGNFTRLQVPGENNMNAVKITVHPYSPNIFQFEELNVPN
jgi:hypothetical protein